MFSVTTGAGVSSRRMEEQWFDKARRALKQRGIRYIDLAALLDCTESAVGHYLKGRREPGVEQLRIIAAQAGMSLSEMVGDDPRFITMTDEKQLLDTYRSLTTERQRHLMAILSALTDE